MTKSLSLRFQGRIWTLEAEADDSVKFLRWTSCLRSNRRDATHRFVFDGGAGHTQVQLAVLLHAGVDQGLDRGLLLEEQEGIAWKAEEPGVSLSAKALITLGECRRLRLPPPNQGESLIRSEARR